MFLTICKDGSGFFHWASETGNEIKPEKPVFQVSYIVGVEVMVTP
jgi:hypothetical protein